jgi:hypothetical protein
MLTFENLIAKNNISMKMARVKSNPILGNVDLSEGVKHYQCRLYRPGREVDVYLSIGHDEERLTLSGVLYLLALDASGCTMMKGYENQPELQPLFFGTDGNFPEIETFWQEFRSRCNQAARLKAFLGENSYRELESCVDVQGDLAANPLMV